jgi:hypothetical protein
LLFLGRHCPRNPVGPSGGREGGIKQYNEALLQTLFRLLEE